MQGFKEALDKVEWPTSEEVSKRFGLVVVVLIVFMIIVGAIDGLFGYLLGLIY